MSNRDEPSGPTGGWTRRSGAASGQSISLPVMPIPAVALVAVLVFAFNRRGASLGPQVEFH